MSVSGNVKITNCTISNNQAGNDPGGGVRVEGGTTDITDSTVSNNSSFAGGGF